MDIIETMKQRYETEDIFPKSLGIELAELSPGYARLTMTVVPNMANFHGIGHGGVVFTLADTAFGLSCNSHGVPAVALTVNIDFLAPARVGDQLTVEGQELNRTRKTGHYQMTVTNQAGTVLASVRGIAFFKG